MKKITVKLAFGVAQFVLALSAILVAMLIKFNVSDLQTSLGIIDSVDFYFLFLLVFGFVFAVSGFFLIYDWWET